MQKFHCRHCGQQVMMAEAGPRVTCPRCGVEQPAVAGSDDQAEGGAEGMPEQLIQEMFETHEQEEARRQREREQAAQAVDDARMQSLARRHALEERLARSGSGGSEGGSGRSRQGVVAMFMLALAVLLIWGLYSHFIGRESSDDADEADALSIGGSGAENQAIAEKAAVWASRLATPAGSQLAQFSVYHVQILGVAPQEGGLSIVKGKVFAADRELTAAERAARIAPAGTDSASDAGRGQEGILAGGGKLTRNEMQMIRDSYDPQRMAAAAGAGPDIAVGGGRTAAGSAGETQLAEDLKHMGFEFEGVDARAKDDDLPAAGRATREFTREFICVVRQDSSTEQMPGSAALDYFIWEPQLRQKSLVMIGGTELAAVREVIERVFTSLRDGTWEHRQFIMGFMEPETDKLFPPTFKPVSWQVLRADRNWRGTVRAFVLVHDRDQRHSGTWIVTMIESDPNRQWRVAATWRPTD